MPCNIVHFKNCKVLSRSTFVSMTWNCTLQK